MCPGFNSVPSSMERCLTIYRSPSCQTMQTFCQTFISQACQKRNASQKERKRERVQDERKTRVSVTSPDLLVQTLSKPCIFVFFMAKLGAVPRQLLIGRGLLLAIQPLAGCLRTLTSFGQLVIKVPKFLQLCFASWSVMPVEFVSRPKSLPKGTPVSIPLAGVPLLRGVPGPALALCSSSSLSSLDEIPGSFGKIETQSAFFQILMPCIL